MKKFLAALNGLYQGFKSDFSLKFHLVAALIVLYASWFYQLSNIEWIIVLFCIASVISAELFNTSIEQLCDFVEPNQNEKIGLIKDIAAGAVLVITIAVVVVGLIIFIPKFSTSLCC